MGEEWQPVLTLLSPYRPQEVLDILRREIGEPPSLWRCILTLNVHYFVGTTAVCGRLTESGFDLRNRAGPGFSLRALGSVRAGHVGSEIALTFREPRLPFAADLRMDRDVIVSFLTKHLRASPRTTRAT